MERKQLIERLQGCYICSTDNIRIKKVDYKDNPLAPEEYAYRISFTCLLTQKRKTVTLWPNTVGFQS